MGLLLAGNLLLNLQVKSPPELDDPDLLILVL
jgi:hypothetical protein